MIINKVRQVKLSVFWYFTYFELIFSPATIFTLCLRTHMIHTTSCFVYKFKSNRCSFFCQEYAEYNIQWEKKDLIIVFFTSHPDPYTVYPYYISLKSCSEHAILCTMKFCFQMDMVLIQALILELQKLAALWKICLNSNQF